MARDMAEHLTFEDRFHGVYKVIWRFFQVNGPLFFMNGTELEAYFDPEYARALNALRQPKCYTQHAILTVGFCIDHGFTPAMFGGLPE